MTETVSFVVLGHVAVITIERPEVRNAIDLQTALGIEAALDAAEDRDDVRCIVFAAAGTTFCAGMDLKAFSATGERPLTDTRGAFGIVGRPPTKPIIAAVEGKALGGGFEIALACDIIVASNSAAFGLPEVKRGLVASAGGVLRLPQRIPSNLALEMILTGEPITAARAAQLGLVSAVVDTGQASFAATALAQKISMNAPLAVLTAKTIAKASREWSDADGFELQRPLVDGVRGSKDAAEGARAFVEKRQPVWVGE